MNNTRVTVTQDITHLQVCNEKIGLHVSTATQLKL